MQVEYSAQALRDIARFAEFLLATDPAAAEETASLIIEAVSLLGRHPGIGRPRPGGLRELVISRGRTGYVALYRVDMLRDSVLVLALRHQREQGFGA